MLNQREVFKLSMLPILLEKNDSLLFRRNLIMKICDLLKFGEKKLFVDQSIIIKNKNWPWV